MRTCRTSAFLKPASDKTKYIEDAIYYRDQFYFVDSSGALFVCELNDLHHDPPKAVLVAPSPCSTIEHAYDYDKVFHLVELLSGELLLAKKLRKYTKNELYIYTVGFSTYKMNPLVELKWMEVHNLCGDTVYLDKYSSLSLMGSQFPECNPNCIYFIETGYFYVDGWSEITVHNDDDESGSRPYYVGVSK
ncbi:hypothetical protein FRX31_034153 [Thalictrum thalictroides]|uniref:KIB1-4 beta-propeller domain-containing protein n=1 Tax=Thalictrum thalictroides TaxID=46969 RepID=A0A7J6UVL2_THATH|nr:hypothetical protein FRX31_034153 [Thalictrum thalictroides]